MALSSKYDGKCKDCGTEHKIGDQIDTNTNDHWCKNGKNCQGAMQTTGSSKPKITLEELQKNYENIDDEIKSKLSAQNTAVKEYLNTLRFCGLVGITDPPVIGMIFNKTMERLN